MTFAPKRPRSLDGFSLVEVAFVLIILGLIIGGVFKGKPLLTSARMQNLTTQIHEYQSAVHLFFDTYQAYPGDFNQASALIRQGLKDGDHDGVISGDGLSRESEAYHFWRHLEGAGLISLNDHHVPTTSRGGVITVTSFLDGHLGPWFVIGGKNGHQGNGGLLTPEEAQKINKKMDNGNPNSGDVRAIKGANSAEECVVEGKFNLKSQAPSCTVYVRF